MTTTQRSALAAVLNGWNTDRPSDTGNLVSVQQKDMLPKMQQLVAAKNKMNETSGYCNWKKFFGGACKTVGGERGGGGYEPKLDQSPSLMTFHFTHRLPPTHVGAVSIHLTCEQKKKLLSLLFFCSVCSIHGGDGARKHRQLFISLRLTQLQAVPPFLQRSFAASFLPAASQQACKQSDIRRLKWR